MTIEDRKQAGCRAAADCQSPDVAAIVHAALEEAFSGLVQLGTDGKYGEIYAERGSPAHDGEPVFSIRGRDKNTLRTIDAYLNLANETNVPIQLVTSAAGAHQRFRDWQGSNADLVLLPD